MREPFNQKKYKKTPSCDLLTKYSFIQKKLKYELSLCRNN